MKPPTQRDPWSGLLALACGAFLLALILIAVAS